MDKIPEPQEPIGSELIPLIVVEPPANQVAPEASPYKIAFDKYIKDECGINDINGDNAQSALKIIRDVGVHYINETNFLSESDNKIQVIPVLRTTDAAVNEYSIFFRELEEDAEVKEIKMVNRHKDVDYRLFYYLTPGDRTFHILALKHAHINIRKGKK